MFDFIVNLRLTANTRSINKGELAIFVLKLCVNRIARCARHIRNNETLLTNEAVNDRGFACIRLADNGYLDAVVLFHRVLPIVKITQTSIKKITRSASVNRRNTNGILFKAKFIELVKLHRESTNAIALVDAGNHRLAALFQHHRNVAVVGSESGANVAHKNDDVSGLNSHLRLLTHLFQNQIIGFGLNSARINENHTLAAPFGLAVDAVARNTGSVLNNRTTLPDELIKQSALANVGTSDNRNNRFCHKFICPFH